MGFATLPNQLHRKSVKKGFDFTLMVAGDSGLGKSTLINSLFLTNLYEDRQLPEASARLTQTLTIERRGVEIEEGGIKVKLTLVDTPGFGDSVDCSDCWLPVVHFIEEQFEQYLRDESGLNRKNIQDSRVHCCLYFISPFGRGSGGHPGVRRIWEGVWVSLRPKTALTNPWLQAPAPRCGLPPGGA